MRRREKNAKRSINTVIGDAGSAWGRPLLPQIRIIWHIDKKTRRALEKYTFSWAGFPSKG
ncbi:hypothetical protein IX84_10015 [Phaeodactylibacter xiamenensis]|uniref:Uncharacterized protein n=1 Tax=Phaeodactylibacter xiamenensis TaxID=1524460 RepID=A0A098S7T2_9BACT|nr:hypothetical protein IX84_10015 [Phaeodactylibacter xiamenensis]